MHTVLNGIRTYVLRVLGFRVSCSAPSCCEKRVCCEVEAMTFKATWKGGSASHRAVLGNGTGERNPHAKQTSSDSLMWFERPEPMCAHAQALHPKQSSFP